MIKNITISQWYQNQLRHRHCYRHYRHLRLYYDTFIKLKVKLNIYGYAEISNDTGDLMLN